jgi:hypothetical protein
VRAVTPRVIDTDATSNCVAARHCQLRSRAAAACVRVRAVTTAVADSAARRPAPHCQLGVGVVRLPLHTVSANHRAALAGTDCDDSAAAVLVTVRANTDGRLTVAVVLADSSWPASAGVVGNSTVAERRVVFAR